MDVVARLYLLLDGRTPSNPYRRRTQQYATRAVLRGYTQVLLAEQDSSHNRRVDQQCLR